jgi:sulfur carrier protein ThiS
MNITVKLFGTLSRHLANYHPDRGLCVEIPEGADAADLLTLLGLSGSPEIVAITEGRVLRMEEKLAGGARIHLLQTMSGG